MSIAKKILEGPVDDQIKMELAGPQSEFTEQASVILGAAAPVNVAHVLLLVNAKTGVVTIASNLCREVLPAFLRETAEKVESGEVKRL
jgi:hypothetical protein